MLAANVGVAFGPLSMPMASVLPFRMMFAATDDDGSATALDAAELNANIDYFRLVWLGCVSLCRFVPECGCTHSMAHNANERVARVIIIFRGVEEEGRRLPAENAMFG